MAQVATIFFCIVASYVSSLGKKYNIHDRAEAGLVYLLPELENYIECRLLW